MEKAGQSEREKVRTAANLPRVVHSHPHPRFLATSVALLELATAVGWAEALG